MSLFNWFSKKPPPRQSVPAESSGLSHVDVTEPFRPSDKGRPYSGSTPPGSAANRKNERLERRELLYSVVRECMIRIGVLSSSYKFKVLSLDSRGRQYLIMMDLARQYAGETARLAEVEGMIAQSAKTRHDILVTAVYWRVNEHVTAGVTARMTPVAATPPASRKQAVGSADSRGALTHRLRAFAPRRGCGIQTGLGYCGQPHTVGSAWRNRPFGAPQPTTAREL